MSDQLRDTNFLELLAQQEKTARYLRLLKEVKDAVKRREINDKQLNVFFCVCILQLKKSSSYCLTSNNPGIVEQYYLRLSVKTPTDQVNWKGL